MHTIANDQLIAPLNFAKQLGVLKHSPELPYLAVTDSEHVKAWRNHFHDVIGHQWSGQHSYLGITQMYME